jgi:hypothetical protein
MHIVNASLADMVNGAFRIFFNRPLGISDRWQAVIVTDSFPFNLKGPIKPPQTAGAARADGIVEWRM